MELPESDVKKGLLANGDMRVEYRIGRLVLVADVVEEHFDEIYARMMEESLSQRVLVLRSVRAAIKECCRKPNPTREQMQNLCDDIALWFCGEVIAGRAPHPWRTPKPLVLA